MLTEYSQVITQPEGSITPAGTNIKTIESKGQQKKTTKNITLRKLNSARAKKIAQSRFSIKVSVTIIFKQVSVLMESS